VLSLLKATEKNGRMKGRCVAMDGDVSSNV
jgi:hypothetical protein